MSPQLALVSSLPLPSAADGLVVYFSAVVSSRMSPKSGKQRKSSGAGAASKTDHLRGRAGEVARLASQRATR